MNPPRIICLGAAHWDVIGRVPDAMPRGGDLPGAITQTPGGVALNIARALAGHGLRPVLLGYLGDDPAGRDLRAIAEAAGIDCRYLLTGTLPTGRYVAVEDRDGLAASVADARGLEASGEALFAALADGRLATAAAPWGGSIVIDGNLAAPLLAAVATSPLFATAQLRIAPASPAKVRRLHPFLARPNTVLHLNLAEAQAVGAADFPDAEAAARGLLDRGCARVIVTDGPRPTADGTPDGVITATPPPVMVMRFTGAGDAFLAAHLAAELRGAARQDALHAALAAAARHISGE